MAPDIAVFCDTEWRLFGGIEKWNFLKSSFLIQPERPLRDIPEEVSDASGIVTACLRGLGELNTSIAEKMSWASRRRTTRVEDEAYCLLGLFGVNMPLLYGEGQKAFTRLQEELIRTSCDQAIFAWTEPLRDEHARSTVLARNPLQHEPVSSPILAGSPRAFMDSGDLRKGHSRPSYSLTNRGLQLTSKFIRMRQGVNPEDELICIIPLNCTSEAGLELYKETPRCVAIALISDGDHDGDDDDREYEARERWVRLKIPDQGASLAHLLPTGTTKPEPERTFFIVTY